MSAARTVPSRNNAVRNRKTGRREETFLRRVVENSRRLMRAIRSQTDQRRNGTDVISMVILKGFGCRVSGFGFRSRVSGIGFRVSGNLKLET